MNMLSGKPGGCGALWAGLRLHAARSDGLGVSQWPPRLQHTLPNHHYASGSRNKPQRSLLKSRQCKRQTPPGSAWFMSVAKTVEAKQHRDDFHSQCANDNQSASVLDLALLDSALAVRCSSHFATDTLNSDSCNTEHISTHPQALKVGSAPRNHHGSRQLAPKDTLRLATAKTVSVASRIWCCYRCDCISFFPRSARRQERQHVH